MHKSKWMKIVTKNITIQNEIFTLTNQRALFWKEQKALVLSDLHIGKTAHFRKNGIALANQIMKNDLYGLWSRLDYQAWSVDGCRSLDAGRRFLDAVPVGRSPDLQFYLSEGNHDRISKALESKLCLNFKSKSLEINNFLFVHDFEKKHPQLQVTGHIHPGFVIDSAVKKIRLPCFVLTDKQLLLPAFSEFTGLDTKNIPKNGQFYVFTDSEIFES